MEPSVWWYSGRSSAAIAASTSASASAGRLPAARLRARPWRALALEACVARMSRYIASASSNRPADQNASARNVRSAGSVTPCSPRNSASRYARVNSATVMAERSEPAAARSSCSGFAPSFASVYACSASQ